MHHLSYFHAIVIGLLQGVTELFPVSSLGHGVILPALFGWNDLVRPQSESESFYLAFLVGLHVGTAVGLLVYYWRDWMRIIGAFLTTLRTRRATTPDERFAWLIIFATIPVGIVGLAFEHRLRVLFAKPLAASIFLTINGVILLCGELVRRRTLETGGRLRGRGRHLAVGDDEAGGFRHLDTLSYPRGTAIGATQILALLAGISRSGITMVAGLVEGLDHEDAARFSFMLATPVILLAGLLKLPDLNGSLGDGVRYQTLVASVCAGVAAWASVRFLVRWFKTRTLWPFGIYCILAGTACTIYFS
ncbi:MAG TPA: undecaprenyl-diphosphate phosphatase [Acidimicrobiales bacterium]|nr:undecaprenyl-diphosphate phosphatase [Acidimicrobiales bacterium]